jgi:hypothetical protein
MTLLPKLGSPCAPISLTATPFSVRRCAPVRVSLTTDTDGNLGSVTLTLNLKPVPNIKIQPEIRYDYTSYAGGLDGKKDRITVGVGVSYLF